MGSVVVGSQRSLDGFGGGPVVPDRCRHGEQPLGDAGVDAFGGAAAVAFEVELAFEGVVDGLDPLADPADRPVAGRLVAAVGADQGQPVAGGDQDLEVAPGAALVPDTGLSRLPCAGADGLGPEFGVVCWPT